MSTKQPIWPSGRFGVPQITPFTYRDGHTHMELIEALREHLVERLHPSLVATVNSLAEQMEREYGKALDQYVNGVEEFQRIHDRFMSDVNASLMALNDTAVTDLLDDHTSNFGGRVRDVMRDTMGGTVVVANDPMFGTPYTKQSVINALDHAETLGKWTKVYFPYGVYNVEDGLDLTGYTAQIVGDGTGVQFTGGYTPQNAQTGTVFHAPDQDGPVLDFRGWIHPETFQGKVEHGGFAVVGSGQPDTSKRNTGMSFAALSSCTIRDISIRQTGGPGMVGVESRGNAVYLNYFTNIVVDTPVDAEQNDVPYFEFNEANGNHFHFLGMRSRTGRNDCGKSGAFRVISNDRYASRLNVFTECWVEYMHVPTDGTIFHVEAALQTFDNTILWDVKRKDGATNTSYWRFIPPPAQDYGSNQVKGVISAVGNTTDNHHGIVNYQDGLIVTGSKGYGRNSIKLMPGVKNCFIELRGTYNNSAVRTVVDNSGNNSNTILDYVAGQMHYAASGNTIDQRFNGIPQGVISGIREHNISSNTTVVHTPGVMQVYTLTGNNPGLLNPTMHGGEAVGEIRYIMIKQDNVGDRTIHFVSNDGGWGIERTPEINKEPNAATVFQFMWSGDQWVKI